VAVEALKGDETLAAQTEIPAKASTWNNIIEQDRIKRLTCP
jgi:hypothetical protein